MHRNNSHQSSSFSGPPPTPRRSHVYDRYEGYPPPPPAHLPPPPPPPQRWDRRDDRDSGRFDSNSSRNQFHGPYSDLRHDSRNDFQAPRGEFTFRQEAPPGLNSYRPQPYAPRRGDRDGSNNSRPRRDDSRRARGGQRFNQSRRGPLFPPHERGKAAHRPLLSTRLDNEPELMLGNTAVRATYRHVDELSDSDEVDMDISDNGDSDSNENNLDRPAKRARTTDFEKSTTPAVPKWSNPDPYTALPPPENTRKKDVVQLIRKARVQAEAKQTTASAEPAEFISCDFSDDETPSRARNSAPEANNLGQDAPPAAQSSTGIRLRSSLPTLPPKPPVHHSQLPVSIDLTQGSPSPPRLSHQKFVDLTPSADLGSRKRTADDRIKPPHEVAKGTNKMQPLEGVVSDWRPVEDEDPCPWVVTNHASTPNAGTRLHKEICDFYEYVRPRDFEEKVRQDLVANLRNLVKTKWPDADIFPFGSFMSGLYLPTADMDIAICSRAFTNGRPAFYDKKKHLYHMKYHVQHVAYDNDVTVIARAKVPLLKYRDAYTGLKVDISFEKMDGYKAITTFLKWKQQYPAMPPLVAVIKHFLLMRGLNEPVNGGLGGFSVICMVVHLLQMMPQVQSRSMKAEDHLGEILMEFLEYYGMHFKYGSVAIRMDPPGLINKHEATTVVYRNYNRLSIIDPNNPENDISGGSSNFWVIKERFYQAFVALRDGMMRSAQESSSSSSDNVKDTLLYPLFAGNYSQFRLQRNWLRDLNGEQTHDTPPRANASRMKSR